MNAVGRERHHLSFEALTGYEMLLSTQINVGDIENGEAGDPPRNSVNNDFSAPGGELVDGRATEETVNRNPVCPVSSSECLEDDQTHQIENTQGAGVKYVVLELPWK